VAGVLLSVAVVATAASAATASIGGPDVSTGHGTGSLVVAPSYPTDLVAGPLPGSLITPGAVADARPWSSARPSGHGRLYAVYLPAPWTGGFRSRIEIDVYLPPGYKIGSARYPVIYEVPYSAGTWKNGMRLPSVLDALITSGSLPPAIVVFADQFGGPYADSQCANSFDGREWFDRFVATDLVRWVDTHLRTIATSAARATFGFSAGGYCSAAILAHHPDVFGSAIVFSGYFVAGIHSGTTPNAWRPFNNDPAIINAVSPIKVIPRIPPALSARLFYVMEADPTQGFYGPQMANFAAVLQSAGVPMALFPTPLGHTWAGARRIVPTMLELVAGRMVTLGVFGPGRPLPVPLVRSGPAPA
jgi:enterochelin esterase-like enzyme